MFYKDAAELLPKFSALVGYYSETFKSKIVLVFIGFMDGTLTQQMRIMKPEGSVLNFDPQPSDIGYHTICVQLENGDLYGVKTLVRVDNLQDLIPIAERLDYMSAPQV